jgi:hypothetical protein
VYLLCSQQQLIRALWCRSVHDTTDRLLSSRSMSSVCPYTRSNSRTLTDLHRIPYWKLLQKFPIRFNINLDHILLRRQIIHISYSVYFSEVLAVLKLTKRIWCYEHISKFPCHILVFPCFPIIRASIFLPWHRKSEVLIIMALQPFVGPWPLYQFLDLIHSGLDSLDGGSAHRKIGSTLLI